jgi:hypothetical protein
VNPHAGATELLIYLEGGGACYDAASCWGPGTSAKNLTGFDEATFLSQKLKPALIRSTAGSPFATTNMAYIPYCTGDMHAGTKEVDFTVNGVTKPTYFFGGNDLDLFLARLVPTFPDVTRVVLLGTSAGGFGTYLNFDKVVRTFGVRVDIIDDSGPPLVAKGATDNAAVMSTWGYVSPTGCSPCTSLLGVMKSARAEQPKSRLGFLSFSVDTIIGPDFGYTAAEYPTLIESLFPANFGSDPNVQTYIVTSQSGHVVEGLPTLEAHYFPWMTAMLNDRPPPPRRAAPPRSPSRRGSPSSMPPTQRRARPRKHTSRHRAVEFELLAARRRALCRPAGTRDRRRGERWRTATSRWRERRFPMTCRRRSSRSGR